MASQVTTDYYRYLHTMIKSAMPGLERSVVRNRTVFVAFSDIILNKKYA
jgi:hypothetical protein